MKSPVSSAPSTVQRKKAYRRWHAWLGVLSAIFMLLVSITAILLEAPRSWRLGELTVPVRWIPGYTVAGPDRILAQIKCAVVLADGTAYVGTRKGLFEIRGRTATPVPELRGKDIFNLALHEGRLLVGTRESAWVREPEGRWAMVADSRGAASFAADGRIVFSRGIAGLHATTDFGLTWTPLADLKTAMQTSPYPEHVTLSQLALDLHTGAALFGPRGMPVYVYIISAVLIVLALSGFLIRPTYLRLTRTASSPP
jgi:hypothetical protein